jgi:hypothetical protein
MHLSVVTVINVGSGEPDGEDMHLIRCSDDSHQVRIYGSQSGLFDQANIWQLSLLLNQSSAIQVIANKNQLQNKSQSQSENARHILQYSFNSISTSNFMSVLLPSTIITTPPV